MSKATITGGKIQLYAFVNPEACTRDYTLAVLPANMAADWEGQAINLIDWRIDPEAKTVFVTYQIREDVYAPILEATLPVVRESIPLRPPTKSRNWAWCPFSECWQNRETGERAYA